MYKYLLPLLIAYSVNTGHCATAKLTSGSVGLSGGLKTPYQAVLQPGYTDERYTWVSFNKTEKTYLTGKYTVKRNVVLNDFYKTQTVTGGVQFSYPGQHRYWSLSELPPNSSGDEALMQLPGGNKPVPMRFGCQIPSEVTITNGSPSEFTLEFAAQYTVEGVTGSNYDVTCKGNYRVTPDVAIELRNTVLDLKGVTGTELRAVTTLTVTNIYGSGEIMIDNPHSDAVTVSFEQGREVTSTRIRGDQQTSVMPLYVTAIPSGAGVKNYTARITATIA